MTSKCCNDFKVSVKVNRIQTYKLSLKCLLLLKILVAAPQASRTLYSKIKKIA